MTYENRIAETTFSGPEGVATFRAVSIKTALRLFARTGIKANRAYTLTNMLRVATDYTGATYPKSRAGALRAVGDLETWLKANGTTGLTS